jgi:hypothetical protein
MDDVFTAKALQAAQPESSSCGKIAQESAAIAVSA